MSVAIATALAGVMASGVLSPAESPTVPPRPHSPRVTVSGIVEHFAIVTDVGRDVIGRERARWSTARLAIGDSIALVGGTLDFVTSKMLDESYLEIRGSGASARFGRVRPAFGLSDWDENWYSGFSRAAMPRSMSIGPIRSNRFDTGAEVTFGNPDLTWTVAALDSTSDTYQFLPTHIDHALVRAQTYRYGTILGVTALMGDAGGGRGSTLIGGIDWRWTAPQWTVRGEYLQGRAAGVAGQGYYCDVRHKPLGWTKTNIGLRFESTSANPRPSELYTVGARHFITPWLTLELNHSWGNDGPLSARSKGWSLQFLTQLRF